MKQKSPANIVLMEPTRILPHLLSLIGLHPRRAQLFHPSVAGYLSDSEDVMSHSDILFALAMPKKPPPKRVHEYSLARRLCEIVFHIQLSDCHLRKVTVN